MISVVVRVAALTGVYLLILTSLAPGDILVGLGLSIVLVAAERRLGRTRRPVRQPGTSPGRRLVGLPALVGGTLVDMARASWQVAGYCLGRRPKSGLVTVPIRPHDPVSATAWAIRVGLAPDTVVVDVDDERGKLLLHVLDASDPAAVRQNQENSYRRQQARVFP
jgi:multisubunit Na+/H+ antiporter MnhE subunit